MNHLKLFKKGLPENRGPGPHWDPSGTLEKPENWDPSGTLEKPENRDPSGTLVLP